MNGQLEPLDAVNERATDALVQALGPVDALRFLSQFRSGSGDYTQTRRKQFAGISASDVLDAVEQHNDLCVSGSRG